MLKVLVCLVFIMPQSFGFLQWIYHVYPLQVGKDETAGKLVENSERLEEIRENEDKNLNLESKKFYENEVLCVKKTMKYDNLVKTIDNYVQRYINLFLITSNLRDYNVKDLREIITVDLEISLSGEDLIYLQGYSKSRPAYPKNFSKLDDILYKIAKQREKTFIEKAMRQSYSFFESFNVFSAFNNPSFSHFFPLIVSLLVTWLIYQFSSNKTLFVFFGMLLNSFLLWESLNCYWKKLKEAEVEIYVKTLELKNAPAKCDPANTRWYDMFLNFLKFYQENECLQYYKNINKNAVEEVSILKCIIDTYSYYLIQTPFRILGASVRDLTEEITNIWPWPIKYFVSVPFAPFFCVAILFFIFIFYMKQFRISVFGVAIELGRRQSASGSQKAALTSSEIPRTNRIIRKLRPWTKSRFSRRAEKDLAKRRKLFLKWSKSVSETPTENEMDNVDTAGGLNESLIKQE